MSSLLQVEEDDNQSAQAKIWKIVYGFADSLVLRCAVELEIADIIQKHGGPISLTELASQISLNSLNVSCLYRIMRHLVHLKLFSIQHIDGQLRYQLEPVAKLLVKGGEQSMAPSVLLILDKDYMAPWHLMKDCLWGDGPSTAFEKVAGKSFWDYMADDPAKNQLFTEAMVFDSQTWTSELITGCKDIFDGIRSVVDVGGGNGTTLRAIAQAFPHLKCTVYDLPHVIADSPNHPEVERIQGDMFKFIPSADALLLKFVLHDWGDEECIKILKRCKEAVPQEGGKVIIVDTVLDSDSDVGPYSHLKLCSDLEMMLIFGGKERTEEEWKKLILDAGFAGCKIKCISAVQSVIEAFPY